MRFRPPEGLPAWPTVDSWGHREWSCWLGQQGWTQAAVDHYLQRTRVTYGLGLQRHPKEPVRWFYRPLPCQVPFHASKVPNVLFGGAAGGSKSHAARWDAYRHAWAVPGFRALLMRRTFQELKRNHMDKARAEVEQINRYLGREVMTYVASEFEIRFSNGSVVIFGHCQNPGDEDRYLSDEYDAFYPDEAATFERRQVLGVAGRLRSTTPGVVPRLGATSNPGGPGALWLVDYFINKRVSREEHPQYDPDDYVFLPSRLYDNPYLMDPDGTFTTYEKRLSAFPPLRRRQLMEGDWYAVVGQFFPEFTPAHHERRELPPGCRIERWVDWGFVQPGVCLWAAMLPDGHIHVFRELVFQRRVPAQVAEQIKAITDELRRPPLSLQLGKSVGDPAMWTTQATGESIAETWARHGVGLVKGDHDRVQGWMRLRQWLTVAPDGRPWLTVDPAGCPYLVRTLPSLVSDDHDPEDCNTRGEDHAADALRYGLMARPSPTEISQETVYPPGSIGWLLQREQGTPAPRPAGRVA